MRPGYCRAGGEEAPKTAESPQHDSGPTVSIILDRYVISPVDEGFLLIADCLAFVFLIQACLRSYTTRMRLSIVSKCSRSTDV